MWKIEAIAFNLNCAFFSQEDAQLALDVAVPRVNKVLGPLGQVNVAVTYDITCRNGEELGTVTKRYSQFEAVDKQLRKTFGNAVRLGCHINVFVS